MKKSLLIITGFLVTLVILASIFKTQEARKSAGGEPTSTVEDHDKTPPKQEIVQQPQITTVYNCKDTGVIKGRSYKVENITTEQLLDTSCLGPDGKAYDPGTQLTFYGLAYKSDELIDPDCNSITKTCKDGVFQGADPQGTYQHLTCRVVDPDTELKLCEYEGSEYLPGEVMYQYKAPYVTLDQSCEQVLVSCNDDGEWTSSYTGETYATCQYLRSFSTNYVIKQENIEITPARVGCIIDTGDACQTPWGTTVEHGDSFLSFAQTGVDFSESCMIRSSTCHNGTWTNEIEPYDHLSCQRSLPNDCVVNGTFISHNSSETFYNQGSDGVCDEQVRNCINGQLDGDDDYIYLECASRPTVNNVIIPSEVNTATREPNCPNPFGGGTWTPGQQGTAYAASEVPFGSICSPIPIVCKWGSIRRGTVDNPGDELSNLAASCTVVEAVGCEHPCGERSHGDRLPTYAKSFIQHGAGETCNDNQVLSTCNNGVFSPTPAEYCECAISEPLGCLSPDDTPVAHGTQITMFKDAEVVVQPGAEDATCKLEWRQCLNGDRYDGNGNKAGFNYRYTSCNVVTGQ